MFLLGVVLLVGFADANKCTNESVQICVENMKQFNLKEYEAIVPTWTEPELNSLCSEFDKTDTCIDALIDDCSEYDQHYYSAVEDSWMYLCEDKKDEFLGFRTCLAKEELHSQAHTHCTKVWENRVQSLNGDKFRHGTGALNSDGLTSLCNSATKYLECVYTEVEIFCDSATATWQREFDDTLIQPVLRLVGCQATTKDGQKVYINPNASSSSQGLSETVIIIIAISIALGVVVMVIIAILLLRQSKKSQMREPPPGEPGPYVVYNPDDGAMGGPMIYPPPPPSYKEKGDLGPEFGIPMPPAPASAYGPPPSYQPAASVYSGRSVASGHTNRSHRSGAHSIVP